MAETGGTRERLERRAGELSTRAVKRMESEHEWYRRMPAEQRSWVGMVAQAGLGGFISWYRDQRTVPDTALEVFSTAPRELARSISLRQTLDLVRTVIAVVEDSVWEIAAPGDENALRISILTYSREIAFAAARVYAHAAESRGAWDARLEALVLDAVIRGESDDALRSRVTALGWDDVRQIVVVAGTAPAGSGVEAVENLRQLAGDRGHQVLAAVHGRVLLGVLGNVTDPLPQLDALAPAWAPGPVVFGPRVPQLFAAGRSARAAMSGYRAAPAWSEAPRPCDASELLPERALSGEQWARRQLIERAVRPLREREGLHDTVTGYLAQGGIEATARALFVHPNTVRYRLARYCEVSGYDVTGTRDAFAVRLAISFDNL
jgi:hypothetical protein